MPSKATKAAATGLAARIKSAGVKGFPWQTILDLLLPILQKCLEKKTAAEIRFDCICIDNGTADAATERRTRTTLRKAFRRDGMRGDELDRAVNEAIATAGDSDAKTFGAVCADAANLAEV